MQEPANMPLEVMCHERAMKPASCQIATLVSTRGGVARCVEMREIGKPNAWHCVLRHL
jgi:hypothetical protein